MLDVNRGNARLRQVNTTSVDMNAWRDKLLRRQNTDSPGFRADGGPSPLAGPP